MSQSFIGRAWSAVMQLATPRVHTAYDREPQLGGRTMEDDTHLDTTSYNELSMDLTDVNSDNERGAVSGQTDHTAPSNAKGCTAGGHTQGTLRKDNVLNTTSDNTALGETGSTPGLGDDGAKTSNEQVKTEPHTPEVPPEAGHVRHDQEPLYTGTENVRGYVGSDSPSMAHYDMPSTSRRRPTAPPMAHAAHVGHEGPYPTGTHMYAAYQPMVPPVHPMQGYVVPTPWGPAHLQPQIPAPGHSSTPTTWHNMAGTGVPAADTNVRPPFQPGSEASASAIGTRDKGTARPGIGYTTDGSIHSDVSVKTRCSRTARSRHSHSGDVSPAARSRKSRHHMSSHDAHSARNKGSAPGSRHGDAYTTDSSAHTDASVKTRSSRKTRHQKYGSNVSPAAGSRRSQRRSRATSSSSEIVDSPHKSSGHLSRNSHRASSSSSDGSVGGVSRKSVKRKSKERRHRSRSEDAAKYDGKYDFKHYLSQFECQADDEGWTEKQMGKKLSRALTGAARVVLASIDKSQRRNYAVLCRKLTALHTTPGGDSVRRSKLHQAVRGEEESPAKFGMRLEMLVQQAHPKGDLPITTLVDLFTQGLNDDEMESYVSLQAPETLEEAIELACNYDALQPSKEKNSSYRKPRVNAVSMQPADTDALSDLKTELQTLNKNFKQLFEKKAPQTENRCYICGAKDHWANTCPQKRQAAGTLPPQQQNQSHGAGQGANTYNQPMYVPPHRRVNVAQGDSYPESRNSLNC